VVDSDRQKWDKVAVVDISRSHSSNMSRWIGSELITPHFLTFSWTMERGNAGKSGVSGHRRYLGIRDVARLDRLGFELLCLGSSTGTIFL
jgi:hypothetical protein